MRIRFLREVRKFCARAADAGGEGGGAQRPLLQLRFLTVRQVFTQDIFRGF